MNFKEAKREFERLGAVLDEAAQQLVEAPSGAARWPGTLERAGVALRGLKAQCEASGLHPAFAGRLKLIERQVQRIHLLLESAAAFYCGCVALRATEAGGYTPDGTIEQLTSSERMQLEA